MSAPFRVLRSADQPPDPELIAVLEGLLEKAKAGEIATFGYYVDGPTFCDQGYRGNFMVVLSGFTRLIHKVNVAIDEALAKELG